MKRTVEVLSELVIGLSEGTATGLIQEHMHTVFVVRRDHGLWDCHGPDRTGLRVLLEVDSFVVTKAYPG